MSNLGVCSRDQAMSSNVGVITAAAPKLHINKNESSNVGVITAAAPKLYTDKNEWIRVSNRKANRKMIYVLLALMQMLS